MAILLIDDGPILVIDDGPKKVNLKEYLKGFLNGYLIEDFLLNSWFFEPCIFHHASTIKEAKELIQGQHFNFIILDPAFSREFGLPLIKTIKDYSPCTKIIAFSLCSTKPCSSGCRQQCLEWGADYHLNKVKAFNCYRQLSGNA